MVEAAFVVAAVAIGTFLLLTAAAVWIMKETLGPIASTEEDSEPNREQPRDPPA